MLAFVCCGCLGDWDLGPGFLECPVLCPTSVQKQWVRRYARRTPQQGPPLPSMRDFARVPMPCLPWPMTSASLGQAAGIRIFPVNFSANIHHMILSLFPPLEVIYRSPCHSGFYNMPCIIATYLHYLSHCTVNHQRARIMFCFILFWYLLFPLALGTQQSSHI